MNQNEHTTSQPSPQPAARAAGNRLDPWYDSYADRALGMRASEVRSLFSVANRPEVVSLAGGMPNIKGLPLDFLGDMMKRIVTERGPKYLQYGGGQGEEEIRTQIVEVMKHEGIHAHPDDIVITTGSQQALDLMTEVFINPGDVIVAEAPSYVGALGVFRSYQAEVVHTPMDDNGLVPEALEDTLSRLELLGKPVKFLYTVPNFHNPGGVTLSAERRPQVIDICRRHNVIILEDNPYGLLGFESEPLPALKSIDPDAVVYLGSFSKIFAPGFRVGWAHAPHAVTQRLVLAAENAILSPNMVGQLTIAEYLKTYDWFGQIKEYRTMYKLRRDATMAALEEYLPDLSWTVPQGGFYTWVSLPEGLDAHAMLPRAVTNLVAYVSGTAFYSDGQGADHLRISYCYPPEEEITEGVRRLARVIDQEKELVDMFGASNRHHHGPGTVENPAPQTR